MVDSIFAVDGNKTLVVRGRKTKEEYKFKTIESRDAVVDYLYSPADITKSEAHALVEEIRAALKKRDAEEEKLLRQGIRVAPVECHFRLPISCLRADPKISRDKLLDWPHIADMCVRFDRKAYGRPTVHARRVVDDNNKFIRWSFTIIDATHRLVYAIDEQFTHIDCAVEIVDDIKESATVMRAINRDVRRMNTVDAMRLRVEAQEPKLLSLIAILQEYGFTYQTASDRTIKDHGTVGLTKLEKMLDQYGADVILRVLSWLTNTSFRGWSDSALACTPDFVHGLCILADCERSGFVHSMLIESVFRANSPDSVLNQKENELSKKELEEIFGDTVSDKSEEGRAKAVFCVLMRQCALRVRNGKLQLKSKYVPQFRQLLNGYYLARETKDSTAKNRLATRLWNIRKKLHESGCGDYWFDPNSSPRVKSLTR